MPRTKVSKNSKRNREVASREEKIRTFEMNIDTYLSNIDELCTQYITEVDTTWQFIMATVNTQLLQMTMGEFNEIKLEKFSDYKAADHNQTLGSQSVCNVTVALSGKDVNRNDEGYLTEDSTGSGARTSQATLNAFTNHIMPSALTSKILRTPGPLHSARARRARRSRSACDDIIMPVTTKPLESGSEHASRIKMRTPAASRAKAFSVDRSPKLANVCRSPSTPPMAFLRWPKPGEIALSKCGSPIVAQVLPDKFANVNIPVKDGVLSLRPKKLNELKPDIIEAIDTDTLDQIKTLQQNLNLIMTMADKVGLK